MKIKKLNPVTIKNFIKNNFISIVIVLLLFIFAVSLYGSRINKLITEGLGEMPDTSNMEKSNSADVAARAISNSDIVKIISEFVTKINNHDIILQSLDSTFAKNTITVKAHGLSPSIKPTLIISAGVKLLNLERRSTIGNMPGFSLEGDSSESLIKRSQPLLIFP